MSIGNKALVSFLVLLIIAVSLITWLSYRSNRSYHEALVWVNHSNDVLYSTEQLLSTFKDVQMFSHNYLLTKQNAHIEDLDSAIAKAYIELRLLRNLVESNSTQARLVDSLTFYMKQRIEFSGKIVEMSLNGDTMTAFNMVASGQGINLMNKLVQVIRHIRQAEQEILRENQKSADIQLKQFNVLFKITLVVILAMTALTVAITTYNSRLESRIRSKVKQVEILNADLQKRERRFKGLIENGFDVISLLDEEIKPIYRSPAAERITGWTNEERKQIVGVEKAHPDDIEGFRNTIRQVLENPGKLFEITIRTQHKEGHYIWLEGIMKNMLHDEALRGIVSNFRDVTERKKIETQRALYASIIQYSQDAIISKSVTGLIVTWNRGAESLFGYKAEEIIGKSFTLFTPDDRIDEELAIISNVLDSIPVEKLETERLTKSGKRINVSLTASPLFDPQGKIIGTSQIARDITEQKMAEEKIHRLNIELEHKVILRTNELAQVNKELEAVSNYIARGVHIPLQEIEKRTYFLQQQLIRIELPELKEWIDGASVSVNEALRLINELIYFSEITRQKISKSFINMNELVERLQNDLPPEIRNRSVISFDNLHPVIGDPDLLKKLFVRLVGFIHSADFESSRLAIKITSELKQEHVVYYIYHQHTRVYDSIFNDINDAVRLNDQTFDRNFIPLLIIRHIVLKHNGTVQAEVVNGSDSRITVSIPINNFYKG